MRRMTLPRQTFAETCQVYTVPMKLNPRYYPALILAAFFIFLLLGLLLGFWPERGGGEHGIFLALEVFA